MRKRRGNRRYYRRLRRKASTFTLDLGPGSWYDLWHVHTDNEGRSRRGERQRREHLRALFEIYGRMTEQAAGWSEPWQSWILIDVRDGFQDAVYFHTAGANFPYRFANVDWEVAVPALFAAFVDPATMQVGVYKGSGNGEYVVRPKGAAAATSSLTA